jgi:xanthine dehydrogenase accessory factor
MKNLQFWKFVQQELSEKRNIMLLIVVQSEGFTPGKPGFKLAVSQNGTLKGTIGGGKVEFDMVEKAKAMLAENDLNPVIEHYSMMNTLSENPDGMICGGKQTVLLFPCVSAHADAVNEILAVYHLHQEGQFQFSSNGNFTLNRHFQKVLTQPTFHLENENTWQYSETAGTEPVVHIVGGGHVSLALSQVLSILDYYVIVYDERNDVETFTGNSFADEKICIPFGQVHERIEESEKTHIIIMTPGHKQDETVLRNTINKNVPYIGMMASLNKRKEIEERLTSEGFKEEQLKKLHSPIGLPIKSSTAAEIAISIAAELIQLNSKKNR